MKVGDIVKRRDMIAVITGMIPHSFYLGRYKLNLNFITEQPQIYYILSDGWEVIESSELLKELL